MEITYKKADLKDLKDIYLLNSKLIKISTKRFDPTLNHRWHKTSSHKDFFESLILEDNSLVIVAYSKNFPIGFIASKLYWTTEVRKKLLLCEIKKLYIVKKYRRSGIGKELMNMIREWSKRNNAHRLRIEVFSKNRSAINFYRNIGFEDYDQTMEMPI